MDERNDWGQDGADTNSEETSAARANGESAALPFYGKSTDLIHRYTHCHYCGSNLHFNHVTDFVRNLTQETARCPECGLQARQNTHRLQ
jgi:hypothetical protein